MSRRSDRVGEEVRAELARLLQQEATDPRVQGVTLTRVELAPDFRHARVFWSHLRADDAPGEEEIQAGLERAATFLRRRLAQELPLRRVPELRFRHDPSLALGSRTLEILRSLERERDHGETE